LIFFFLREKAKAAGILGTNIAAIIYCFVMMLD